MKLKALLCAGLMLATSIIIPSEVYAETTYASASELITDAIEVAVTGVTSPTYNTAISNMQGRITMSGDMVSYDGTPIGYWYSYDSDTIWSDSARTSTVLTPTDDGVWEFKPTVLQDILTDFNNDLIENVVPTTEDWSKIIGKYDVTLGDVTIPADQWIPMEASSSVSVTNAYNFSVETGITHQTLKDNNEGVVFFSYTVYDGELYITEALLHIYLNSTSGGQWYCTGDSPDKAIAFYGPIFVNGGIDTLNGETPYIRLHNYINSNARYPQVYFTNLSVSTYGYSNHTAGTKAVKITNPAESLDADINTATNPPGGIAWFTTSQLAACTSDSLHDAHIKFFTQAPQSSKQQIGNTLLKQRLSKFSALTTDDTVEVSSTGWTVIGLGGEEKNFDTYLGIQGILNAGDTADIAAVADAEALAFYVVAPTSLPVYMDSKGEISVATNASIENKSAASVTLTSVQIEPKADSGWTMVQTTPSRKRDANEFTFSTSLVADTAIDTGAEHPFTYAVDLSPTTEGFESLDLASVLVTVDWTEVT